MAQEAPTDSSPRHRNVPARTALVVSILFLIPTVVTVASNGYCLSTAGGDFFQNHPGPSIPKLVLGMIFEVTFLWVPFAFLSSLFMISIGTWGLLSAIRSKGGVGKRESLVAIGLALLVMVLCVAGAAQWGSAWKQ